METFRETFTVHSYDVDAFGVLAVPALTGFLMEAAGLHANRLGVGLEALMEKGATWVLARQRLEIPVAIRLGDVLVVETWPTGIERPRWCRCRQPATSPGRQRPWPAHGSRSAWP